MKNFIKLVYLPTAIAILFTGCCSTKNVANPKEITFVQALKDVGTGLAQMRIAELSALSNSAFSNKEGFATGLFPSQVSVTFNVAASASNSNQLAVSLNAGPIPNIPVSGSIGNSFTSSSSAARANQITITFTSALFGKTTTTTSTNGAKVVVQEGTADPVKLEAFLKVVKGEGIQEYLKSLPLLQNSSQ